MFRFFYQPVGIEALLRLRNSSRANCPKLVYMLLCNTLCCVKTKSQRQILRRVTCSSLAAGSFLFTRGTYTSNASKLNPHVLLGKMREDSDCCVVLVVETRKEPAPSLGPQDHLEEHRAQRKSPSSAGAVSGWFLLSDCLLKSVLIILFRKHFNTFVRIIRQNLLIIFTTFQSRLQINFKVSVNRLRSCTGYLGDVRVIFKRFL